MVLVAGCAQEELVLKGAREALRPGNQAVAPVANPPELSLPPAQRNAAWPQRIGTPATRTPHAALATEPRLVWRAVVGSGNGKRHRLTADPVMAEGRIFTLDTASEVVATDTQGGRIWQTNLTPPTEQRQEAQGGGLAFGDGRVFATLGYGRLVALDAQTGAILWQQRLGTTATGSPSVYQGRVYVVAGGDTAWALRADNGRVLWQIDSLPDLDGIHNAAAPALGERLAVFGYGSGELHGVFRQGGVRLWTASLSGGQLGRTITRIGDISGDPVIDAGRVYAANHSGRLAALDVDTGRRLWTLEHSAIGPIWPAGESIFLINGDNQLMRIEAQTGEQIWVQQLPRFVDPRRKRQVRLFRHYGPVLAGTLLWVASSDGLLRSFDPQSGAPRGRLSLPGGAGSSPIVVDGTLYVLNADAELLAFR